MADPAASPPEAQAPSAVARELDDCIQGLARLARNLREALVARDATAIWDTLAAQEESVIRLEQIVKLWHDMAGDGHPQSGDTADRLRKELTRLQGVQRSNAALAQSFLSGIRKTLSTVGRDAHGQTANYTAKGRKSPPGSSRLLRLLG